MRHVKLFLASGNNLKKDRDEVSLFLANKNQFLVKHGIFLELIRWEFLSSSFSETRKQDDFNQELKDSDVFTCLIYDRIGQYTREEFEQAFSLYKSGKNPKKFYLYFKVLPKAKKEEATEVNEFRKHIEEEQQIYLEYKNPDQLKLFINQNLDQDLPDMFKEALLKNIFDPVAKPMTDAISQELLDSLNDADKMLARNLTEEALDVYMEAIRQVNKQENPDVYGRILYGLAVCYINFSLYKEQEKNLINALIKLENAEELLEKNPIPFLFYLVLEKLSLAYMIISSIRNKIINIEQSLKIANKLLIQKDIHQYPSLFAIINRRIGNCYNMLMHEMLKKDYYDKAQFYFQEVLKVIDKKRDPIEYHRILAAIGDTKISYSLIETDKNERIKLLNEAISLCKEGLELITIEEDAYNFCLTNSSIATAYTYLGKIEKKIDFYLKAIEYYKKIETLMKQYSTTVDYLTMQSNYCTILQFVFDQTKEKRYLDESKKISESALETISMQSHPYRYGRFHANIGYCDFLYAINLTSNLNEKIELIKNALSAYNVASSVIARNSFSVEFKQLLYYQTKALIELSRLEIKTENLLKAQKLVEGQLESYTIEKEKDIYFQNFIKFKDIIEQEKKNLKQFDS